MMGRLLFYLLVSFPLLCGVVITGSAIVELVNSSRIAGLPSAEAVVVESSLTQSKSKDATRAKMRAVAVYIPKITLSYAVDGVSYMHKLGDWEDSPITGRQHAASLVSKFSQGSKHSLRYDPDSPQRSFYAPDLRPRGYNILAMGLIITVLGGLILRLSGSTAINKKELKAV